VNWPRDPLYDASFGPWPAGDTFLLYPGPRASVRWELLRDGIEEAEKIRALRAKGDLDSDLRDALTEFDFKRAEKMDDATLATWVQRVRIAIEAATAE
ncbi:MAG: DUF4091 domain-containing protein, partial [Kiritimatiellia bacterium]